jgi:hypothetical protein
MTLSLYLPYSKGKKSALDTNPSTSANSNTNYIIFRNAEIFKNYFSPNQKKYCEG